MAKNIEIKAVLDHPKEVEQKIRSIAIKDEPIFLHQVDTFFNIPYGRLKFREINQKENELIFYLRSDVKEPKRSLYFRIKPLFPTLAFKLLNKLLVSKGVIEKERKLYIYNNIRIHIDNVRNIGQFIEFEYLVDKNNTQENGYKKLNILLKKMSIKPENLCTNSYIDLSKINISK